MVFLKAGLKGVATEQWQQRCRRQKAVLAKLKQVWDRRGFTRQPENSKRAHLSVPALQSPPKIHQKTLGEKDKKNEIGAGEGKKSAKFWGPQPSGSHPSGPSPFWERAQRGPPRPTPQWRDGWAIVGQLRLAKVGQNLFGQSRFGQSRIGQRMAKVGLAKVGISPDRRQAYHSFEESLLPAQSFSVCHARTGRPVHELSSLSSSNREKPGRDSENEQIRISLKDKKSKFSLIVEPRVRNTNFKTILMGDVFRN